MAPHSRQKEPRLAPVARRNLDEAISSSRVLCAMTESHTHPPAKAHTTRLLVEQRCNRSSKRFPKIYLLTRMTPPAQLWVHTLRLSRALTVYSLQWTAFARRTTKPSSRSLERAPSYTGNELESNATVRGKQPMNPEVLIIVVHPAYASRARPELSSLHFETRPFRTQPPGRFCQLSDTHTSSSISSEYTTPTGGGTSCKISCKGPRQHNDGTANWCREARDKQRPHMRYWLASRSWCLRGRRCLFVIISRT
jgi:hypothetical protein